MNTDKAKTLARELMHEHGLTDWRFAWDRARRRFGACHYHTRTVSLSYVLTLREEDEGRVRNTILHEIAHALVGPSHSHDHVWRSKAISIGCNGRRCSQSEVRVERPFEGRCPTCGITFDRFRRVPRAICSPCHGRGIASRIEWRRK